MNEPNEKAEGIVQWDDEVPNVERAEANEKEWGGAAATVGSEDGVLYVDSAFAEAETL